MMDFYLKELPDNTVTLINSEGLIIGKFDSPDETEDILFDSEYDAPTPAEFRFSSAS